MNVRQTTLGLVMVTVVLVGTVGIGTAGAVVGGPDGVEPQIAVDGAEFVVSNFQGPSQADVGERVTATAIITNTGAEAENTMVQYRIADQVIASTTVTVAPESSVVVSLRGSVPSLSTGTYQQGVFIGTTTNGETGQIVIGSQSARFAVLSLNAPEQATPGTRIDATATIKNTGDTGGTQTFQYRIAGQVVSTREITLAPDEQSNVRFAGAVPTLAAGSYLQGVFEGSTNNGLTARLTVSDAQASFSIISLEAPARVQAGEEATATVAVRNTGDARGTKTLRYRIDGTTVAIREVTLDPGAKQTVSLVGIVPDRSPGTYQQTVAVDGSGVGLSASVRIEDDPAAYFRISRLDAPAEATARSDVLVTARVTNTGDEQATVPIEYRIGSRVLERQRVTLRPDQSTTVEFEIEIPTLSRGTYTQGMFVDDTNRGQTTSLRIVSEARFSVSNLVAPPTVRVGDQIAVKATVRNSGDRRGTATVEYRIGNRLVAEGDVRLDAGDRKTVTLTGTVPDLAPANYLQGVFVDGDGETTRLTVTARPQPRAVIAVTGFEGPTETTVGESIEASVMVENTGDAAGIVTLEYRLDDRVLGTRQVTVDPGESRDVTFEATVPRIGAGTYQHGVFIAGTADGRSDEIRIDAGTPRFAVSDVRGPAEATVGDAISVRATVTNTGTAAGRTEVQYRLGGDVLAGTTVELAPGEGQTVTFDVTVPDVEARTYRQGVFLVDSDEGQTTSLVVGSRATPTPRVVTRTIIKTPTTTEAPGLDGFGIVIVIVAMLVLMALVRTRSP